MFTPEPLSLVDAVDEAKTYVRIETDEEDGAIAALLTSAAQVCEQHTATLIINREVTERLAASPQWRRLGAAPVTVIENVTGYNSTGSAVPLAISDFAIDIDANGDGWVRVMAASPLTRIDVTYRAGTAANWDGVAQPLRLGIVRLAAHYFTNRDATDSPAIPPATLALWHPFRAITIGSVPAKVAA